MQQGGEPRRYPACRAVLPVEHSRWSHFGSLVREALQFPRTAAFLSVLCARYGGGNPTNHACGRLWWARRSSVGRTCSCFGQAGTSASALVYPDCEAATGPLKLAIPMEHRRALGCHSALSRSARPGGNPGTGAIACASLPSIDFQSCSGIRVSPCCSGCNWHRAQWGAKNRNWGIKSLVYREVFGDRPGMSLMEQVELR